MSFLLLLHIMADLFLIEFSAAVSARYDSLFLLLSG